MTKNQWLDYATLHRDVLTDFLKKYHPGSNEFNPRTMNITAPNAEAACQQVRASIIKENKPFDVERTFKGAFLEENDRLINHMLNQAWFGVPESTACWNIEGFTEAVTLMESYGEWDVND